MQLPGQYSFTAPPTAYDGMVYAGGSGSGGTIYGVSEATGQVIYSVLSPDGADKSSPAVNSTGLYVSYACLQDFGFHLDGLLAWQSRGPCYGGGGSTAVLHGDSVYARARMTRRKFSRSPAGATPDPSRRARRPRSTAARPDEQNADVLVGMAVGDGLLVIPANNQISAFG